MAQNLNIILQTTPVQNQWNNGLNECQNVILNDVILKAMEDTDCNLELAIAWSLNSKMYFA